MEHQVSSSFSPRLGKNVLYYTSAVCKFLIVSKLKKKKLMIILVCLSVFWLNQVSMV